MSGYSDDPIVHGLVLVVVNDGNGSECGLTYGQRCHLGRRAAFRSLPVMQRAAARADARDRLWYGSERPAATVAQLQEAARLLVDYYQRHAAELEARRMAC